MLPRAISPWLPATLVRPLYLSGKSWRNACRAYTTSIQADNVIKIIEQNKNLNKEEKILFRNYWACLSDAQIKPANTILQKMPLDLLVDFVHTNRQNSSTARGFYRRELVVNWENAMSKVTTLIEKLHISKDPIRSKQDILTLCVDDSLGTKDIIIAAELYILFYKLNPDEPLNDNLCTKIVTALAFEHPRFDHIHLIKYLDLQETYETHERRMPLSQTQIVTLCNKAIALENSPILTKQTLNKLMDIEMTPSANSTSDKLIASYHLIEKDYLINNAAGVLLTWTTIKNHYASIEKHDPRMLHKIIKLFTRHKAYRSSCKEIITQLPAEYYSNSPLLLPTLIDYATKVGNLSLAKELMTNVNKYLLPQNTQVVLFSRRCLSSFLRMHLKFNDSKGVDRTLNQILESFVRLSEDNLLAIVSHLIEVKSLENLTKAVQLTEKIPIRKSLLAYGSIINKIIEWQIASDNRFDSESMPLLEKLLKKAHRQDPQHKSAMWNVISSLFIKKIVHHRNFRRPDDQSARNSQPNGLNTTNLDLAKLIYINSNNKAITSSDIDINPFANTSPQHVILKITNGNRLIILRNIALSAIKGRRKDIFLWSCSKLYQGGMPTEELLMDWNRMFSNKIRRTHYTQKAQIEDDLRVKGLPFLKKALH